MNALPKLAVVAPFHQRPESALPLLKRLYVDSTRAPDETWFVCETEDDRAVLLEAFTVLAEHEMLERWPAGLTVVVRPTPREQGRPTVLPYAHAINYALDHTTCDLIAYLDNGSMPWITKYKVMVDEMAAHPEWGACYVGQKRTGYIDETFLPIEVIDSPYCRLNFTQPCHRLTEDRWPTALELGNPDVADGLFFQAIAERLGAFHPVGVEVLDEHHMPAAAAMNL